MARLSAAEIANLQHHALHKWLLLFDTTNCWDGVLHSESYPMQELRLVARFFLG